MTKAPDPAAELPITIRPQKGSALATLAAQARAQKSRGALSELVHGWAAHHVATKGDGAVKAATPPPDISAFD